jgi:tetratricopeptide (TPR) repeat protein
MMRLKPALFAVLAVALFFAAVELGLWVAGVPTLLEDRDPFVGFSDRVRVFEADPASGEHRTLPRAVTHSFNYQTFRSAKPDNGLRIFILGGSSAYGFPWGARQAFGRFLAEALAASRPERAVEVVNAAAMSYGSHRLRILAREVLRYEPDLLVVYGGHNEFVERRFYRDAAGQAPMADRVKIVLYRWRLYSALARLYAGARATNEPPDTEGKDVGELLGIDVSREHAVDVGDDERAVALRRFRENLDAILRMADETGVATLLCTVPSNLRGWSPNQSVFGPAVDPDARASVRAALEESRAEIESGDPGAALATLRSALDLAPGYAETHYLLGRAYDALGRFDEALLAYTRARDRDAKPTRASTAINDAVRSLARERAVPLVDLDAVFREIAEDGLPGFDLFQDYVHPTPSAHRRIAMEIWRRVEEDGLVGDPRPADPSLFRSAVAEADPVAADAGSPALVYNLAVVLENQGRIEDAKESYQIARDLDPRFFVEGGSNLARLLYGQQRYEESAAEYRRVLEADPEHLKSLIGLGESLRALGRIDDALDALDRATRVDPGFAPAWNRSAVALSQLGRLADAENAFRRAVELEPDNPDFRTDLGFALLIRGDLDGAAEAFESCLAHRPHHPRARNGLAAVLTERGELDTAERIFRENLRADPDDAYARAGLETVRRRRAGSE